MNTIEIQTDSLESMIEELNAINELTYRGYNFKGQSISVDHDNIDDVCEFLRTSVGTATLRVHLVKC